MRKKCFWTKTILLCFISLLFIQGIQVSAYDYGQEKTVVNNGGDHKMYSTDGGRYFQYAWNSTTEFGLKSRIREHKISMQPQGTNYWAYERGISFPEPLEIGTDFELVVDAYGYAYGSKVYAYNDLTQAQMNAKVKVIAEITLSNGRIVRGDTGTMGGYNDGRQPIYKEHYGYTYNTSNMPSWTTGQKVKAVYLKVVDAPQIPSSGDDRYRYLYLIDSMTVKVRSMTNPSNGRIYRTTSDNGNKNIVVDSMNNGNVDSLWVRPQDSVYNNAVKPINLWMYTFQKQASSSINRINKNYMKFVTTYNPKGTNTIDERYMIDEKKNYSHYNNTDSTSIINDGGHDFYRTSDTGQYEYCSKFRVGFDWDNVDYDVYICGDSANGKYTYFEKKATLKTDGRGPVFDKKPTIEQIDRDRIKVVYHNVYDIRGEGEKVRSGVGLDLDGSTGHGQWISIKRPDMSGLIYYGDVKYIDKGKSPVGNNMYDFEFIIDFKDSKFSSLNLENYYGDILIQLGTYDELDNASFGETIRVERKDLFNIEAQIKRVLEPHEPIFKEGEKGILDIKTFYGVERVEITFPRELTDLDSTLNTTIELNPENDTVNKDLEYDFFIPLDTPPKKYRVKVTGYKNGEEKTVYPTFEVKGSILRSLRTRIRR